MDQYIKLSQFEKRLGIIKRVIDGILDPQPVKKVHRKSRKAKITETVAAEAVFKPVNQPQPIQPEIKPKSLKKKNTFYTGDTAEVPF